MTDLAGMVLVAVGTLGACGLIVAESLAALGYPEPMRFMIRLRRVPLGAATPSMRTFHWSAIVIIVVVTQGAMIGTLLDPVGSYPAGRQAIAVIELAAAAGLVTYLVRGPGQ